MPPACNKALGTRFAQAQHALKPCRIAEVGVWHFHRVAVVRMLQEELQLVVQARRTQRLQVRQNAAVHGQHQVIVQEVINPHTARALRCRGVAVLLQSGGGARIHAPGAGTGMCTRRVYLQHGRAGPLL
jgi:hypothetical protein